MATYIVALLCVLSMAAGQILFKFGAIALSESGSVFNFRPALLLLSAIGLYGLNSIAWIWVLQRIELGKVYPFMALAFIFVPIFSYFIFGEKFSLQYFFGVALITSGVFVTVRA